MIRKESIKDERRIRDEFALLAMQEVIKKTSLGDTNYIAKKSFEIADSMMRARSK